MTSTASPNPQHMTAFCEQHLVKLLIEECQVDTAEARLIGKDILARANAFAALDHRSQDVLAAPFAEEVFSYEPAGASLRLKAAVAVVVRNSRLEDVHARKLVGPGFMQSITTMAAAPLSHLLAAHRQEPLADVASDLFASLAEKYPRAWACLEALAATLADGGRTGYRSPVAPVPALPPASEHIKAALSTTDKRIIIHSAIDPRFDQHLIEIMRHAAEQVPGYVRTLSRLSRNEDKLFRILEFLLAHDGVILTTNYLLRSKDVWVRRKQFVKPDDNNLLAGLQDTTGLSGSHRELALRLAAAAEEARAASPAHADSGDTERATAP